MRLLQSVQSGTYSPQPYQAPTNTFQPIDITPSQPKKQELLNKIGSGLLKFGKQTAVHFSDIVTEMGDFTTDFIANNLDSVIRMNPVGLAASAIFPTRSKLLKAKWKEFYEEQKRQGRVPANQAKMAIDKLEQAEFMQPSEKWQQSDLRGKFSKELILETVLHLGPSIFASVGAFALNPAFGFSANVGSTANQVKDDAITYGVREDKAELLGLGTGILVSALDKIVPTKTFGSEVVKNQFTGGLIRRLFKSTVTEGLTEVAQEDIQIAAERTFRDDLTWDEITTRNVMAGFGGILGGSGMEVISSYFNKTQKELLEDEPGIIEYIKQNKDNAILEPQQAISAIINTPLENTSEGKEIVKAAIQAQSDARSIKISYESGNLEVQIVDNAISPRSEELKKQIDEAIEQQKEEDVPEADKGVRELAKSIIRTPDTFRSGSEEQSFNDLSQKPEDYIGRYTESNGNYFNSDSAKNLFENYKGENAFEFERVSGAVVDLAFNKFLNDNTDPGMIVWTAGGSGSGKSKSVSLIKKNISDADAVFDSTLSNLKRAEERLEKSIDKGFKNLVMYVYRPPDQAFIDGVLQRNRDGDPRVVTISDHLYMHEQANKTVRALYQKYKDNPLVEFRFYDNSQANKELDEVTFESITKKEYNTPQLQQEMVQAVEDAFTKGEINETQRDEYKRDIQDVSGGIQASSTKESGKAKPEPKPEPKQAEPKLQPEPKQLKDPPKKIKPKETKAVMTLGGLNLESLAQRKYEKTTSKLSKSQLKDLLPDTDWIIYSEKLKPLFNRIGSTITGVKLSDLETRPNLLYGGMSRSVFSDGVLLIQGKEGVKANEDLLKKLERKEIKKLQKVSSDISLKEARSMARKMIEDNIKRQAEANYPEGEVEKMLSVTDNKKAVKIDGFNAGNVVLSNGEKRIVVDADKLAFMRKYLPKATLRIGAQFTEKSYDVLAFIKNGKRVGMLMPIKMASDPFERKLQPVKDKDISSGVGDASIDTFQDLPKLTQQSIDKAISIPFPEIVGLAKELMGKYPIVTPKPPKRGGSKVRGMFIRSGEGSIKLNAEIFSDVDQAAKTLAHEVGHLFDYIPDQNLSRGNLLGRIGSMHKFLRSVFTNPENESKIDDLIDRRKSLQARRKEIRAIKKKTKSLKRENSKLLSEIKKINKQIEKLQEKAIKNKVVFKELWTLSKLWRPLQVIQLMVNKETGKLEEVAVNITEKKAMDLGLNKYLAYRKSSRELYADAISVLLNDPKRLEKSAPTFWHKFLEQIDRKPDVKKNLFAIWDLLNEPEDVVLERRLSQIYKGYTEAKNKRKSILDEELPRKSLWERLMRQHVTRFDPIYRKLNKTTGDKGIITSPKQQIRMALEEMQMRRNSSYLYIDSIIQDISHPLEKIGLNEDDLGVLLQLERNLGDRKLIANPYGLQGDFSKETLEYFRRHLASKRGIGEEKFIVLQQIAKRFREMTFGYVELAKDVGVYSLEFFNNTALPNKDTYATYQVIEYIHENYVSAGIKQATGTLKPIENPLVSTILKTMAVIEQVELQKGKLAFLKVMEDHFSDDISPAKAIRPKGVRVGWQPEKNKVPLEYFVDGKIRAVNVDPYLAEMFETYTPYEMHNIVKVSGQFNRFFKPLVTTYNISWGLYSNIIRDTKRTYKNLNAILPRVGTKKGVSIVEFIYTWLKSIPEARKFQRHDITPLLKEALENRAFTSPFTTFDSQANEADWLKPIIRRFKPASDSAHQMTLKKKLIQPISKILEGVELVGSTLETTSKLAGYQIVRKRVEGAKQRGFIVRNYVGTPNFIDGGTQKQFDNNVFVFSNVMLQALRTDIELASHPQTKSGYWFRTMQVDILPKMLMLAGAAGLFGELVKEIYEKATEYDKTNYLVIPLGLANNGKAVYWRIPQDETGRFFSALVWKLGSYLNGDLKKPEQIAQLGAGWIPSMTPIWEVAGGWLNYIQGRNPYDSYRGRPVVDDTTWKAGGLPVFTKMVQWTSNELGLSQFTTYTDETDSTFDATIKTIPVINRAIRSTDYGLTEKERHIERQLDQDAARRLLNERELLDKYIKLGKEKPDQAKQIEKEFIKEVLGDSITTSAEKRRRTNLTKKYQIGLVRGVMSREMDSLIEANTNDYKLELLKLYKNTLGANEYQELRQTALKHKIISDELQKRMRKEGI